MFTLQIYTKPYSFGNIFINKLGRILIAKPFYSSTNLGTQFSISTGNISNDAESAVIVVVTIAARVFIGFFWSKMKLPML